MLSRSPFSFRVIPILLLATLSLSAFAQTPPTKTPPVRKDRLFLKDIEGVWINEAYLSVLSALKSPHAAARKTLPVVIAIRREGRGYPIVVTDFNKATLEAVLDLEPDGKPGAYRLVVGADDKPTASTDVKFVRFEAAKNTQGKVERLRVAELTFMKGKWAEYVPITGELSPQLNRLVIAGTYRDANGGTWKFSETGESAWPGQTFFYELSLNDPGASCDYLQSQDPTKGAADAKAAEARKRYGFNWKAGKLSIYPASLKGKKVVCETKPLAVLTPQ